MLEVKQPGYRFSAYYNGLLSSTATTLYRGMFVKIEEFASVAHGPAADPGGPKYAASGDRLMSVAISTDTVNGPVFPVGYHLTKTEDSDLSLDTIASGHELVYFQEGEFETDQYGAITDASLGKPLFLDAAGKLTDATGGAAIAMLIGKATTWDSNFSATGMLWFRMADWPYNTSGGALNPAAT